MTWVLSGDEHVAEYRPPSNVMPMEPGQTLEDMLAAGEVVAATGAQSWSLPTSNRSSRPPPVSTPARQRPPINHTLVVRNELLASHPDLAADLFDAFARAKRIYVGRLKDGASRRRLPTNQTFERVMEITGDPLPYGIAPNRREAGGAAFGYSVEQGDHSGTVPVELFAAGTEHWWDSRREFG